MLFNSNASDTMTHSHTHTPDRLLYCTLKPWFHVQLLHAIILRSGRGYSCQSVCMTSLQRCRLTISLVTFSCNLTLTVNTITSTHKYVNTSTKSRDSSKRCHWLQHFCLMSICNMFESLQLLRASGIAARCIAHETTALNKSSDTSMKSK